MTSIYIMNTCIKMFSHLSHLIEGETLDLQLMLMRQTHLCRSQLCIVAVGSVMTLTNLVQVRFLSCSEICH